MFALGNPAPQPVSQSLPRRSRGSGCLYAGDATTASTSRPCNPNHPHHYMCRNDIAALGLNSGSIPDIYTIREGNLGSLAATFPQSYQRDTYNPDDIPVNEEENLKVLEEPFQPSVSRSSRQKREVPAIIDTYTLGGPRASYSAEPTSAVTVSSSEHSSDIETLSSQAKPSHSETARPRKPRREKPRIELAPDQPPTTQGKPRARVYVACLQCRTRKIRCDGAKPICHNCSRRANGNECNYDPLPKRRGPDKMPGARQRTGRDVRGEIDEKILPTRRTRRRRETSSPSVSTPSDIVDNSILTNKNHSSGITSAPVTVLSSSSPPNSLPVSSFVDPFYTEGISLDSFIQGLEVTTLMNSKSCSDISAFSNVALESSISIPTALSINYYIPLPSHADEQRQDGREEIASEPSLTFSRKIWWDSLLSLYSSPTSNRLQILSPSQRESAAQSITSDLRFLFGASNYWFSFFHIPTFFGNYFDPTKRERIQPSLVLAMLAMSTFWQSSELGIGRAGRERALRFRDEAQSAMEASFNAGWIDETLAQAAWLLALFEVCAHPYHSSERSTSSMIMLDSIIRSLSLTLVDADDPHTSIFSPGSVPAVLKRSQKHASDFTPSHHALDKLFSIPQSGQSLQGDTRSGCSCVSFTLAEHWPSAKDHAPLWACTPAWNMSWSEGEIRKESCRRLCWSSMILAAGHISYTTAHRSHALDLFIADPANYAILFSGESVAYSPTLSFAYSSKDTIWALHDRSFLLWHGCIRMRNDTSASDNNKAHFAVKAWLEADALESALNKHTCGIEKAFIYQAREYIFNTRMCISYEFQRYIPLVTANISGLFHRDKAEEWLNHQAVVAQRFMLGLHTITGNSSNLLARRPFFVFWFMGQVSRAMSLWQCDNTLIVALDVCKALLPAIDYLTALWPCSEQRHRYEDLREKLDEACYIARVSGPPPLNLTLPPPSSHQTLI